MRNWLVLTLVVTSVSMTATSLPATDPPKPRQYQIDLAILMGDPLGSPKKGTIKTLAEPRIVTLEKKQASFISGGEVKVPGGEFVPQGLRMSITPEKMP